MEIIKRKILLESLTSRYSGSTYGIITATTISLLIPLTQDIKDLGMVHSLDYTPKGQISPYTGKLVDYTLLINELILTNSNTFNFSINPGSNFTTTKSTLSPDTRNSGYGLSSYISNGLDVSGYTESRIENSHSYGFTGDSRLIVGKDVNIEPYINFNGVSVTGLNKVISNTNKNPIIYTEFADSNDINYGNIIPPYQDNGILFMSVTADTTVGLAITDDFGETSVTKMFYKGQSFNMTNVDLYASTRQEYLLHITTLPKVESDVFIERGGISVIPIHGQLAEINTLEQLEKFGNGFYKIIKE
jgi:hypothetical protein